MQESKDYVIQCQSDNTLLWSNEYGWVDNDSFDEFTLKEKETLNLPIEGEWILYESHIKSHNEIKDKYLTDFEIYLLEKYGANSADMIHMRIHSKVDELLDLNLKYWSNKSFKDIYTYCKALLKL